MQDGFAFPQLTAVRSPPVPRRSVACGLFPIRPRSTRLCRVWLFPVRAGQSPALRKPPSRSSTQKERPEGRSFVSSCKKGLLADLATQNHRQRRGPAGSSSPAPESGPPQDASTDPQIHLHPYFRPPVSRPQGAIQARTRKYCRGTVASTGTSASPVTALVTVAIGVQGVASSRFVAPSTA